MGDVVAFRRHALASAVKVKRPGLARLPSRSKTREKIKKCSAGMHLRAFQFKTAVLPTRAKPAAASSPPIASTTSPTVSSMEGQYSRGVSMSITNGLDLEIGGEFSIIHAMKGPPKTIAIRLQATMGALEVTSAQVCRDIGVSSSRWSQYVTGIRPLTLPVALKLCATYGLTLDWIYRGDLSGLPQRLHEKIRLVA